MVCSPFWTELNRFSSLIPHALRESAGRLLVCWGRSGSQRPVRRKNSSEDSRGARRTGCWRRSTPQRSSACVTRRFFMLPWSLAITARPLPEHVSAIWNLTVSTGGWQLPRRDMSAAEPFFCTRPIRYWNMPRKAALRTTRKARFSAPLPRTAGHCSASPFVENRSGGVAHERCLEADIQPRHPAS